MHPVVGQAILAAHLVVIAFNIFGLIAIPLGAALGWGWVRIRWWRGLHLASLAVVALQAALGRACFLTIWQSALTGQTPQPLITRFVNSVIYWPLPLWAFTGAYIAVFFYTLALWRLVAPTTPARDRRARDRASRRA